MRSADWCNRHFFEWDSLHSRVYTAVKETVLISDGRGSIYASCKFELCISAMHLRLGWGLIKYLSKTKPTESGVKATADG
jgi:hypothetical protein